MNPELFLPYLCTLLILGCSEGKRTKSTPDPQGPSQSNSTVNKTTSLNGSILEGIWTYRDRTMERIVKANSPEVKTRQRVNERRDSVEIRNGTIYSIAGGKRSPIGGIEPSDSNNVRYFRRCCWNPKVDRTYTIDSVSSDYIRIVKKSTLKIEAYDPQKDRSPYPRSDPKPASKVEEVREVVFKKHDPKKE